MPSLPKGGGVDKDKYEGDESELIEAARVAEAILCRSAPAMADADLSPTAVPHGTGIQFSAPTAAERAGATPLPVPRVCPRTLRLKRANRVHQPQRAQPALQRLAN